MKERHGWDIGYQHHIRHMEDVVLANVPLRLIATFYISMSDNNAKAFRKLSDEEQAIVRPHIFIPDLSNLIKYIEDVCKGILYHDDCLIAEIQANKRQALVPRTEFRIEVI